MFRRLVRWRGEVLIAQSATTAAQPDHFLAIFENFHFLQSCFLISCNRSEGHFYYYVLSIPAGAVILVATLAIIRKYILKIAEVQQRPELTVAAQYNMTSTATITTIRPTV